MQELHILQHAPVDAGPGSRHPLASDAVPGGSGRQTGSNSADAEAMMAQLRLAAGGLAGARQQAAASVLGPSHNLPTRTLAQQVPCTSLRMPVLRPWLPLKLLPTHLLSN